MIKISKITIQRFRSIMSMELKIDNDNNIISICGPNNVGKTNTLRAMNLFFNPDQYNPKLIEITLPSQSLFVVFLAIIVPQHR
jgi:predicted ATP-dependent endonuclease of OLD family